VDVILIDVTVQSHRRVSLVKVLLLSHCFCLSIDLFALVTFVPKVRDIPNWSTVQLIT